MLHVLPSYLIIFGAGAKVIVLLWQTDAALIYESDFPVRIFQILFRAETEEGLHADALKMRDLRRELIARLDCCNTVQLRLDWRQPCLVDGRCVYAACVVVANLLFIAAGRGVRCRSLLQNAVQRLQVELIDVAELIIRGQICRNRMQFAVVAAGVLIKVHAWIGGGIHRTLVEAGNSADRSRRLRMNRYCRKHKRRSGQRAVNCA